MRTPGDAPAGSVRARLPEKLPVLVNPRAAGAGGARKLLDVLAERGVEAGVEEVEPERLMDRVRELAGSPIVAVAGGDGSMRSAAEVLAGGSAVLAPIPLGRVNDLSRRLGIGSVKDAAAAIAEGRTRSLGVGVLADEIFLNTAALGGYRSFVRRRDRWSRFLPFGVAAAAAFVATLRRWQTNTVTVETSQGRLHRRTALLWVGVGRGSHPFPWKAEPAGEHGELELVLFPATRWSTIKAVVGSVLGVGSPGEGGVEVFHAREARVEAEDDIHATLDGEPRKLARAVRIGYRSDAVLVIEGRGSRR